MSYGYSTLPEDPERHRELRVADLVGAVARAWWVVVIAIVVALAVGVVVVRVSARVVEARTSIFLGTAITPTGQTIASAVTSDPTAVGKLATGDLLTQAAGDACSGQAAKRSVDIPRPLRAGQQPTTIDIVVRAENQRCAEPTSAKLAQLVADADNGSVQLKAETLRASERFYKSQQQKLQTQIDDANRRIKIIQDDNGLTDAEKALQVSVQAAVSSPLTVNLTTVNTSLQQTQLLAQQAESLEGARPLPGTSSAVVSPTYRTTLPVAALAGLLVGLVAALIVGLRRSRRA